MDAEPRQERLSIETLRELLDYDPETGILTWKERPRHYFKRDGDWKRWNARWAGQPAGSPNSSGYLQLAIFGVFRPLVHVVAWALQTGEWPEHQVDHENHQRDDNRWSNLRAATHAENMKNKSRRADNKSGIPGVYWDKRLKKWRAQIREDGCLKHLPCDGTLADAIRVRTAHEIALGYHPNNGTAQGERPLFGDRVEVWTE